MLASISMSFSGSPRFFAKLTKSEEAWAVIYHAIRSSIDERR